MLGGELMFLRKSKSISVNKKYILLWNSGGFIIGSDWIIAKNYLKAKNFRIGLIEINNQLIYSVKSNSNGSWKPCRAIKNSGDRAINKKNALKDYFHNYLLNNQSNFTIIELKN